MGEKRERSREAVGNAPASERLRDILSVADTSLNRLEVDDLWHELLERVRDILEVDTAAVLLLDQGSRQLVSRAASGLEEEVRQGVRVPLGAGFAGRIAQSKQPLVIERVDPTTVDNPILWGKGLHAMLGVPLVVTDRVIGVMHVGSLRARDFGPEDIQLLELAAERVAAATQARVLAIEEASAGLLERSLMPPALPVCPGNTVCPNVTLAARYVPAERAVGGDWYDAFTGPSGELWVMVGDVAGHGLRAAALMGHVRSALRSYALLGGEPGEVLALTDRKLQHFEPGTIVTVSCGVAAPPFETFRLSTAGHPVPVLAPPDRATCFVDLPVDLPLGARPDVKRSSKTITVPQGSVLTFYTDGLVERRHELLEAKLEQLRSIVTAEDPEIVCQRVMARLVGAETPSDDIALLALRSGEPDQQENWGRQRVLHQHR